MEDSGFLAAKPALAPFPFDLKLTATAGIPLNLDDASSYRRLIGRLLYLQISRPDVSFAVHKLSQYVAKPYTEHLSAAHHLLCI